MTNINNPTTKNMQAHPQHPGIFQDAQGRTWTAEAIDQLIVGHVHGGYTFTPIAIYLSRLQPNLSKITSEEAEVVYHSVLFHTVVQKTEDTCGTFRDWTSISASDAKVQEILKEISEAVDAALTEYLNSRGHGLSENKTC